MTSEGSEAGSAGASSEEEMRAAFEEQLRRVSVPDVLLQTTVTLINLGARRLGLTGAPDERDPAQARLAIEGARSLVGLLPAAEAAQLREPLSQLQIAYAREAQAAGAPEAQPGAEPTAASADAPRSAGAPPAPGAPPPPGRTPGPGESPDEARRRAEEAERAKARSKIWTPRGA
jgi:hypothetical protein